jgi:hypothetical protein
MMDIVLDLLIVYQFPSIIMAAHILKLMENEHGLQWGAKEFPNPSTIILNCLLAGFGYYVDTSYCHVQGGTRDKNDGLYFG